MTDSQAKIVSALRQSNTALTQAELAERTDLPARDVSECCYALGAAGFVNYRDGFYSLTRAKR